MKTREEKGAPLSELERRRIAYRRLLEVLPAQHRDVARATEKKRPDPDVEIRCVTGLVEAAERQALTTFGHALYSRQIQWDAGRNWFEEPSWTTMESTHDAFDSRIVDMAYCLAAALDDLCRIKRYPLVPPFSGLLRANAGFAMVPSRGGRGDLRWCYCIRAPETWGGVYFPWYKSAIRLTDGDAFACPGDAWPGFAPVVQGTGWFMLSHEPPEYAKRTVLVT